MYNRYRITTVIIVLLAYLSYGLIEIEQAVLCFGSDGHVAIEASFNGRCINLSVSSSQSTPRSSSGNSITPADSHCGTCIDIPFLINSSIKNVPPLKDTKQRKKMTISADFSAILSTIKSNLTDTDPPVYPPLINVVLSSLSTVIHLI